MFNILFLVITAIIFPTNGLINKSTKQRLNSGQDVPLIGIGMGGFRTGGPPKGELVRTIIRTAVDAGYRHIDTAKGYENEEAIGQAVNELINEGIIKREDIFITTKMFPIQGSIARVRNASLDGVLTALEKFNTTYLDLMLIHQPSKIEPVYDSEMWKGLEDAQNMGLVKSIGVSNFDIKQLQKLLRTADVFPAMNQIESYPTLNQKEMFEFCMKYKIRVTAYSPLGAGTLVTDPRIVAIGQKYNRTAAQVMIRWHLQRGFIAIPKSTNENRIRENINVFDFNLNDSDITRLNNM